MGMICFEHLPPGSQYQLYSADNKEIILIILSLQMAFHLYFQFPTATAIALADPGGPGGSKSCSFPANKGNPLFSVWAQGPLSGVKTLRGPLTKILDLPLNDYDSQLVVLFRNRGGLDLGQPVLDGRGPGRHRGVADRRALPARTDA